VGCTIDVQLEMEKDLYVIGDNASLSLAFHNLLNNAVKYASEESPLVSIRAKRNGNDISVEVSDNGRGIADDEKKKIFQKFYRVGDESVRSSKGTGLGLYLVRKILHWHNADIWVEDNKPRGSVFRIVFRL
jgi:signal transduction histidine kinase